MMELRGGSPEYKLAEKIIKAFDSKTFSPDILALALCEYGGGVIADTVQFLDLYYANLLHIHGNRMDLSVEDSDAIERARAVHQALTDNP